MDQILNYSAQKAAEYADSADLHSAATQSNMLNLLLAPIKSYFSLFTALALPNFLPLFTSQTYSTRRSVAGEVARSILKQRIKITTPEHLEGVLSLLKVIIKEGIQQPGGYPGLANRARGGETDETIEEQGWLARIVHLIQGPDNDTQLKVLHQRYIDSNPYLPSQSSSYSNVEKLMKPVTRESNTRFPQSPLHRYN